MPWLQYILAMSAWATYLASTHLDFLICDIKCLWRLNEITQINAHWDIWNTASSQKLPITSPSSEGQSDHPLRQGAPQSSTGRDLSTEGQIKTWCRWTYFNSRISNELQAPKALTYNSKQECGLSSWCVFYIKPFLAIQSMYTFLSTYVHSTC